MADISVKDYIARAKELEVAVYKQKRLMAEHEHLLSATSPHVPTKQEIVVPSTFYSQEPQKERLGGNWWFLFLGGTVCGSIAGLTDPDMAGGLIFALILLIV